MRFWIAAKIKSELQIGNLLYDVEKGKDRPDQRHSLYELLLLDSIEQMA